MYDSESDPSTMARRIVLTLPKHLADYLESHPDCHTLITDAVHQRMARAMTARDMLEAVGFRSTEESRAWARRVLRRGPPTRNGTDAARSGQYDSSMTRRITVSLPDDVAAYLDRYPNSSAVVADALRAAMARGEAVAQVLRAVGINATEEGADRWRDRVPRLTEAQRAKIRERRDEVQSGRFRDGR
jgi:Arc/MetJ-type ribon-helix-helix transcriptional regulator